MCRTYREVSLYRRLKPTLSVMGHATNYSILLFIRDILGDTRFCTLQKLKQHRKEEEEKEKKKEKKEKKKEKEKKKKEKKKKKKKKRVGRCCRQNVIDVANKFSR